MSPSSDNPSSPKPSVFCSLSGTEDPENRLLTREARDMALPQLVEVTPAEVLDQIDQR